MTEKHHINRPEIGPSLHHRAGDLLDWSRPILYPQDHWGLTIAQLASPLPHVTGQLVYVPEGILAIACCAKCGGRHETVADLRYPDSGTMQQGSESMLTTASNLLHPIHDMWLPEHLECGDNPRAFHMPSDVQRQLDRRIARAAKRLGAGRDVLSCIALLCEDGRVLEVPVHDLPESNAYGGDLDRQLAMAERQFRVREWRRITGVEILAAVLVGEAWAVVDDLAEQCGCYPSQAPDRLEIVHAAVVTSSMAMGGFSEIRRSGGRIGEGRGTFDRPVIDLPIPGRALLLDGLLATSLA